MFKRFAFFLLVVFVFFPLIALSSLYESVDDVEKKAKEVEKSLNGTIKKKVSQLKKQGEKDAKEVYRQFKSQEFQKKVKEYEEQLKPLLMGKGYYNGTANGTKKKGLKHYEDFYKYGQKNTLVLGDDEVIYVFVSSSMPEEIIRNYLAESEKIDGRVYFVLRGGIEGLTYVRPTVRWIAEMLKKDKSCDLRSFLEGDGCDMYEREFWIQPLLFRQFKIDRVPAVVYVNEGKEIGVVSPGAVSLKRHLKRIGEAIKDRRLIDFGSS